MKLAQKPGTHIVSKSASVKALAKRVFWWMDGLLFYLAAFSCLVIILAFACGVLRFTPWPVIRNLAITQHVWLLLLLPPLIYGCFAMGKRCMARAK